MRLQQPLEPDLTSAAGPVLQDPGEDEMSPWVLWAVAATSSAFVAWVVLPAGFLFAGLLRPGSAALATRLDAFRLLYFPVFSPDAYADDPLRIIPPALGLVAFAVLLALLLYVAVALLRHGRDAWPAPVAKADVHYETLQAALGVAMLAMAAQSVVQPVPSRPVGWWFLVLAMASATAWLSRRRPGLIPAVAILCTSASLAIGVDLLGPTQGLSAPGVAWELLGGAAAATATVAAVWLLADTSRWNPGTTVSHSRASTWVALVLGTTAAAGLGLLAIVASAAGYYASPAALFGSRPSSLKVVVLSPHIDDEAAFAGETIAWLEEHGADVTVVYTTDSRGGRALDKEPGYVAARRVAAFQALSTLGVAHSATLADVRDGNRMSIAVKTARIESDLRLRGLVGPRTTLVTVSGTGHPDHIATFAAARELAREAGIPLFVAWGYDTAHDLMGTALNGEPHEIDGGALALWKKATATDDYIDLYQDGYPFTLPRALLAARGSHDHLSEIPAPASASAVGLSRQASR